MYYKEKNMEKRNTKFESVFGDSIQVKTLDFFLEAGKVSFPVDALVEEKEIGKSQAYETINKLIRENILVEEKVYKKKKYYKLNLKNLKTKEIQRMFHKIIFLD